MPLYTVTIERRRKRLQTSVLATSAADARERARRQGGRVISVKRRWDILESGLSPAQRHLFLIRLAGMLTNRVGMADALRRLGRLFSGRMRVVTERLSQQIETGASISVAMESLPKDFPHSVTALVRAGTASGNTAKALKLAAEFEQRMIGVRKEGRGGLFGALAGFVFSAATMVGSSEFAEPYIMGMTLLAPVADDPMFGITEQVSFWTTVFIGVMLVLTCVAVFLATVGRVLMPTLSHTIIKHVIFLRDIVASVEKYALLFHLSELISGGVHLDEALALAAEQARPGPLKKDLVRARDAVRRGREWTLELRSLEEIDRMALASATHGREVAESLNNLADQTRQIYEHRLAVIVPVLKTISYMTMTISVVVVFIQTTMPMLLASSYYVK